jgi:hypothetical protein
MAPFDMCYQASALSVTQLSYAVATIDLMLEGGRNWTMFGGSSLVQVNDHTDYFTIVEMGASMPAAANSAKRWEAEGRGTRTAMGGRLDPEVSKSKEKWAYGGQLPHHGCGRSSYGRCRENSGAGSKPPGR